MGGIWWRLGRKHLCEFKKQNFQNKMAQRRRMEIPVVDESNDRTLDSLFQSTAREVSQLYSLASNKQKISFDAGKENALVRVYEWIRLQLQDGKFVTAADVSAYLQNELNTNFLNTQQLLEQLGSRSQPNNNLLNTQLLEELARGSQQIGASQEMDGNVSASQDQEMDINS